MDVHAWGLALAMAATCLPMACGGEGATPAGGAGGGGGGGGASTATSTTASTSTGTGGAGGGPSVDLSIDPKNCGWLGHDCRGAVCSAGLCASELVSPACRPGDFVDNVSDVRPCGPNGGTGMAIQGTDVLWFLGVAGLGPPGALYRASTSGAPQPTIVAWGGGPRGATVFGDGVLFAAQNDDLLFTVTPSAVTPFRTVDEPASPQSANGKLLWLGNLEQQIWRLDSPAATEQLIYEDPSVPMVPYPLRDFVVSGDDVYFANCAVPTACFLAKVPLAGGPVTILAENQRYVGCVGATSSRLFWNLIPTQGTAVLEIRSMPLTGGSVVTVGEVPEVTQAAQVFVDGDDVFALDQDGIVRIDAAATSSAAVRLALPTGGFSSNSCHQVTTDGSYLYFVTARGEVRRVAR